MKTRITLLPVLLAVYLLNTGCSGNNGAIVSDQALKAGSRTDMLFDSDWHFIRSDIEKAELPEFDDSSWRLLDLPHDWSIEDLPGKNSPIDSTAAGGLDAGYLVGGTSWYRKTFSLPASLNGKLFQLQFDGIYMNAEIWLNGKKLGIHPYGYTGFRYDITGFLNPGKKNTLAVRVRNEGHNSRWYSGSGIYRHVRLSIMDPVHLDPWWISVTTPVADMSHATVNVSATVFNELAKNSEFILVTHIINKSGTEVALKEVKKISAGNDKTGFDQTLEINSPDLWSPESPSLYTALNEVYTINSNGERILTDKTETHFGIRSVVINIKEGFLLNGKHILIKGGCMHHDNGPLGAAAFDRAEVRRVELMKASGFNAIRCAHNPPSPAFLDACDSLGMMVIDESFDMWKEPKNPDDYHLYFTEWWQKDVESMIRRDRNHPSVILWSIGNEIMESGKPEGATLARLQGDFMKKLDPSRMITSAVNNINKEKDPYFATLDVAGYNYGKDNYVSDHKRIPERIMLCTESFPLEAFDYWMGVKDNPWVIGDFVWTGFDYLGEASIGWLGYPHDRSFYPWTHAFCGDIDICGFKRPQSFYRDVLWENGKNVSIFVKPPVPSFPLNPKKAEWSKWEWQDVVANWNWDGYERKSIAVEVYSSCPEVELFLNDKSLGKKKTGRENRWIAAWDVPYEPGVLNAKGYDGSSVTASSELETAGNPVKIKLTADRETIKADGQDLSYVIVELLDSKGVRNPASENLIKFKIEGQGTIQAVGSSNPMGTESFKLPQRKAYQGRCLVILRAGKVKGNIILKASGEGIGSSQIKIVTK
jgi:beta-galactosidase